jgi:hypothetical protein
MVTLAGILLKNIMNIRIIRISIIS